MFEKCELFESHDKGVAGGLQWPFWRRDHRWRLS